MTDDKRKRGYKNPPPEHQFQPGTSGNPNGRPKESGRISDDLAAELSETIAVTEGGRKKRITKRRALIKSLYVKAMSGDLRAAATLVTMAGRLPDPPKAEAPLTETERAVLERYAKKKE